MALLKVTGVSKKGKDSFEVRDIHFTQEIFQKIAIAGETGSGKTTLLKIIAGLIQPDDGEILFDHKRVEGPYEKLIPGHPGIAYLSQHFELRNNYRVEEELEAVNILPYEKAKELYSICRIEHLLKRKTDQLSGGERQRIVLARLLSTSPKLILLDEPFSNLDALHRKIIKSVINDIGIRLEITCILVSHDPSDVLPWADKILVMKDGILIQQGTPKQIYYQPINEYCAGLFGEYNLLTRSIFGINLNDKQAIARPEHFIINSESNNTPNGIVRNILFCGSYFSIDVFTEQQLIRVQTNRDHFSVGESVHLSLSPANIIYL